jgi:hypothetical protein
MQRFSFASLKSYGDFLIALQSIRAIDAPKDQRPGLISGTHVAPLQKALAPDDVDVRLIDVGARSDVPALFDIRKRGLLAAASSLVGLRRQLSSLAAEQRLVFDARGLKERWICPNLDCLPAAANIYLAYADYVSVQGLALKPAPATLARRPSRALVVPGSRVGRKVLPVAVIQQLSDMLGQRGFDTAVLLMPGEAAQLPPNVQVTRVERSFEALVAAIAAADVIISSDSLPAHIAGYVGRPMFVVTPEFNRYWLPPQAFSADSTATFDDLRPVAHWLETLG